MLASCRMMRGFWSLTTGVRPDFAAALDRLRRRRNVPAAAHPDTGFPRRRERRHAGGAGPRRRAAEQRHAGPLGLARPAAAAAYTAPDIGTVTPLSNEASILSYPGTGRHDPPDQAATNRLDCAAAGANAGAVVDIPVGGHFCLYLRRDCLNAVGSFRADRFAQGYGEENDFCLRARRLGWRNVALRGCSSRMPAARRWTPGPCICRPAMIASSNSSIPVTRR